MYSSRVPVVLGRPVSTCVVAGCGAGGSQTPGLPVLSVSLMAATTLPTLVVMCNAAALADWTSLSRFCTTIACGGTTMPESAAPSSGPLSVWTATCASAATLSVLIRYNSVCSFVAAGPTNQKSEPGAWHRAVGCPVGPSCSTSNPWASAPVADTINPLVARRVGTSPPAIAGIAAFFTGATAAWWMVLTVS